MKGKVVATGYLDPATGERYMAVQTEFGLKMVSMNATAGLDIALRKVSETILLGLGETPSEPWEHESVTGD